MVEEVDALVGAVLRVGEAWVGDDPRFGEGRIQLVEQTGGASLRAGAADDLLQPTARCLLQGCGRAFRPSVE